MNPSDYAATLTLMENMAHGLSGLDFEGFLRVVGMALEKLRDLPESDRANAKKQLEFQFNLAQVCKGVKKCFLEKR